MRPHRGAKRAVGPLRPGAAVEDAVRVRILAAVERVRKRLLADTLAVRVQPAEDLFDRLFVPARGRDQRMDFQVARIRRQGLREVDEIAIEVDVLLGGARLVRETPGILRVKENRSGVLGQARPTAQPGALRGRTGIGLDAVRAAADDEHARRVAGPEDGDVQVERLAARPAFVGMLVAGKLGPGAPRGFDEFAARLGVGVRECLELSHPGAAGAWTSSIARASLLAYLIGIGPPRRRQSRPTRPWPRLFRWYR
jgi:hypothetical protein